jgi:hypothetical protein
MLLAEPKAVAHSPTFREPGAAVPVLEYLVDPLTVTVIALVVGVTTVVLDDDVPVREPAVAKDKPLIIMVDPETDVTWPKAAAKLAGRASLAGDPVPVVRVGKVPLPVGTSPPAPPPKRPAPPRALAHLPLTEGSTATLVAWTTSAVPFVPVAVMQDPVTMVLMPTGTVAVILVLAVKSTVVWPLSALWTSSVLPVMLAIVPEAAGAKALAATGRLGTVVDVLVAPVLAVVVTVVPALVLAELGVDPPPHAAATSDTATKVPATRASRRAVPDLAIILFITVLSFYFHGNWVRSLDRFDHRLGSTTGQVLQAPAGFNRSAAHL